MLDISPQQQYLSLKEHNIDYSKWLKQETVPFYVNNNGVLFDGDCLKFLPVVQDEIVDTVFADPPFNLNKVYGENSNDIPPVRHRKFKSENRKANALSTKLLDRVIEMSSISGDLVLDPFGGSGTTFAVCEKKNRKWIGIEIDFAAEIVQRLCDTTIQHHRNEDFVDG